MEKYERWFGESPELSILRLMGLFDRPAEANCVSMLRSYLLIPGLTDTLVNLHNEDWNWAVSTLQECGLIARNEVQIENYLDAHPLVREHFATQLTANLPAAASEAHRRLYEYRRHPLRRERWLLSS